MKALKAAIYNAISALGHTVAWGSALPGTALPFIVLVYQPSSAPEYVMGGGSLDPQVVQFSVYANTMEGVEDILAEIEQVFVMQELDVTTGHVLVATRDLLDVFQDPDADAATGEVWHGVMNVEFRYARLPGIVPEITSLTPPTIPGGRLLEGEPFTLAVVNAGTSGARVYWANQATYKGALVMPCAVTSQTGTSIVATACAPGIIGNDGYIIVVHENGNASAGVAATLWEWKCNLTMEDAAHRWPDGTTTTDGGTVDEAAVPAYEGLCSFKSAVDGTVDATAYGKDETDWPGYSKAFLQARLRFIDASVVLTDMKRILIDDNGCLEWWFYHYGGHYLIGPKVHGQTPVPEWTEITEIGTDYWYLLETLYEMSAVGKSNGIGKVWLDGVLRQDLDDGADEDMTGNLRGGLCEPVKVNSVVDLRWEIRGWGRRP